MWVYRRHWWDLDKEQTAQLMVLFLHSPALQQAYFLRHRLTFIFETDNTKAQALEQLDAWQTRVAESGLRCFNIFLTTLGNWRDEICNYFKGH